MRAGRRAMCFAGAVVAALSIGGAAPAATGVAGTAQFAVGGGCQEHQAFVEGDEAAVAARLPKRYTALRNEATGKPLVFARAMHCDSFKLAGRTAPVTVASFGVVIDSPDGRGCGSGAPTGSAGGENPPLCNWYVLFYVANDRRVVDFLRHGTAGYPAVYVPNLRFESGDFDAALGGAPLHFEAPAPTPSPFTMDDVARERPGEIAIRVGYWTDTPQGTVKLAGSSEDISAGDATGVVRARPGSEMAKVFGAGERPYLPGYSAFAAVRIGHGSYRKQVIGPAPRTDSFAGSCSLRGTDHFTPPSTNSPKPLTATYDGSGTCTGKLNGKELSSAPVKLHQAGLVEASCPRARSLAPGPGTLTFPDGTSIGVTFDFVFVATEGSLEVYGARSGFAGGKGTYATQRTPPDITAQCGGEGVKEAPLDMTFATESPLVSQRPASPQRSRPRRRLRLAVSPRRVESGERIAFRFKVTSKGRGVTGAIVRFAGRRAVTGRKGRARIVAMLRRSGHRDARALKPGFATAHASVRVRRG